MKKVSTLPLLGVSVLSLGLVGLSVFTPVVNAVTTADSTFNVTVDPGVGIVTPTDPETQKPAGADVTFKQTATLKLQPATTGSTTFGGSIINNSGEANLTLTDKDGDTGLNMGTDANKKTIATADGAPTAAKASWAVAVGKKTDQNLAFKAVPANNGTPINVLTNQLGATDFYVTYAASAAADTAPGTYTDTLTYTLTAINPKP